MAYSAFAQVYDSLTGNACYKERAEYILSLCQKYSHSTGLALDLACGTGSLTLELKKMGVDVYGVDASPEMLSEASMKAFEEELDVLFLCQKMQSIDLYGTIDTCVCTLDSINHLTNPEDVRKTFDRVSLFMNPEGLFIFDVNTPYKHQKVLADNVFAFDAENAFTVWQNTPIDDFVTEITLDFFTPCFDGRYMRETECFRERAYTEEELRAWLAASGFEVLGVFGDMNLEPPKDDEQRLYFVAKKL